MKPSLPFGWVWLCDDEFDADASPIAPNGPRRVGVYVYTDTANNGALIAKIHIDAANSDDRVDAVTGALHGIDVFCAKASIRDEMSRKTFAKRLRRWALFARAAVKRWLLLHL